MKKVYNGLRNYLKAIRSYSKALGTSIRKLRNGSDYSKWTPIESLSSDWDSRTIRIAKLVEKNSSVIEFGAGRQILNEHLPENCRYIPSDMVDRGNGTIVCDLNGIALPQFPECDVAVFSGVLEYVNDVSRLVSHLKQSVGTVIASYAISETNADRRRARGWVNDLSSKELIEVFTNLGFDAVHEEDWGTQRIFVFKRIEIESGLGRIRRGSKSANFG